MTKENLREPGDFVPFSGLRGFDFAVDLKIAGEVFDAFASVEEDKLLTPKDRARRGLGSVFMRSRHSRRTRRAAQAAR